MAFMLKSASAQAIFPVGTIILDQEKLNFTLQNWNDKNINYRIEGNMSILRNDGKIEFTNVKTYIFMGCSFNNSYMFDNSFEGEGYINMYRMPYEGNDHNVFGIILSGDCKKESYSTTIWRIEINGIFFGSDKFRDNRMIQGTMKAQLFTDLNGNVDTDLTKSIGSFSFKIFMEQEFEDYGKRISVLEMNQSSQNKRISTLESNMTLLQSWKQTIIDSLSNVASSITSLFGTSSNHETRISFLENKNNTQSNITVQNYWKCLDSGTKKDIVCGIAIDNHLTTLTMQELGWSCNVSYRQTSRGEKSTCRCDRV